MWRLEEWEIKYLNQPSFEGTSNVDGELEKEGILVSHPYIKGLIFHASEEFYAVAELTESNLKCHSLP